jgi:uncharacterized coiled-coil protein SlyX
MFRSLSSVVDVLNPGLAQARESLDRLREDLRTLNRSVKRMDERDHATQKSLESLAAQLASTTRELRTVNDTLTTLKLRDSQLRAVLRKDAELEDDTLALPALLNRPGIGDHITGAIESAALQLDPFPHIVVENLLPDDLYDALILGLPPVELFGDKPVNKQQLKVPFEFAPVYARRVWRYMADVVAPQFITPTLVDKFAEPLLAWVRDNWPELGDDPFRGPIRLHSTDGRIMLRTRGYRIPPHRDPKWGFLTCLVYLVRAGDSETWGTQLYSVSSDREARGAAPHWIDPATCTLAGEVGFRRNRALVFLNSVGAHGAFIPADAEPENLERYLYQFRIGPTGGAISKMMSVLTEERRPLWAGKSADY